MIAIYMLIAALRFWTTAAECEFPKIEPAEWHTYVRHQLNTSKTTINFLKNRMSRNSAGENDVSSYNRFCVRRISNDEVVVSHSEIGKSQRYLCIRLTMHAPGLLQLFESNPVENAEDVHCHGLLPNPWILISDAGSAISCPLKKAYNTNLFDQVTYSTVCSGYIGETWLEASCDSPQTIGFRFRRMNCVPPGLTMAHNHDATCIGAWTYDVWQFILLKDGMKRWLFRYPKSARTPFTALLFKDLIADTERSVTQTNNLVRFDMTAHPVVGLDQLCRDDYQACSYFSDPCQHGPVMQVSCSRSCKICNNELPSTSCTFDDSLYGQWFDIQHAHGPAIDSSNGSLLVANLGSFHCIKWGKEKIRSGRAAQLVVSVQENGCRPRYRCIRYKPISSNLDSVLWIQVSASMIWPWFASPNHNVSCSDFDFHSHSTKQSTLESRHLRPLIRKSHLNAILSCNISGSYLITTRVGKKCQASVIEDANKKIHLDVHACGQAQLDLSHQCFYSSKLFDVVTVIISQGQSGRHFCWLNNGIYIYVLSAAQCSEASWKRLERGKLRPLGKLQRLNPRTSTDNTDISTNENIPLITYHFEESHTENPRNISAVVKAGEGVGALSTPSLLVISSFIIVAAAISATLCC